MAVCITTGVTCRIYMYMFMLSKFPELIDTLFLVVRGRAAPFLHWYAASCQYYP